MISMRSSRGTRTILFRILGAFALVASATACKSEEDLRFWGDGSGKLEIRVTIENEAASTLDEARREIGRRGFTVSRQAVDSGTTTLYATRPFSTIEELNEAPDSFRLEIERIGPLQRTFRFHHESASQPKQLGFSRVFKVRFPVPVRSASAGTIAGQSVVWDASSGGSLSIEASGYGLPFGHGKSLLFWAACLALFIGLVVAAKLRTIPLRRCGKCHRPIDLAVRFCPTCGTANDVDQEEGSVLSVRQPRAVPSLRLLARALSLAGLGVLLFLTVYALPAELAPAASRSRGEALSRLTSSARPAPAEKSPTAIGPESFLAGGAFDLVTGRPRVWYTRGAGGAFALFDGPGFDPASRLRLQPLTPEVVAEAEAWAREESELRRSEAEALRHEQEREEADRRVVVAREEQERWIDRYIDRSALGNTPVRRAAVVHVLPTRDLALDRLALHLRDSVEAKGFEVVPLFRNAFSRDEIDRDLFTGSSTHASELRLGDHCSLLVLAQAIETRPTVRTQHFHLAELELDLRTLDPATGRTLRSAQVTAKGGGPSTQAARGAAVDELGRLVDSAVGSLLP